MQVRRYFKRFVSFVLTVSVVVSSCLISSGAASEVYTSIGSFWTMAAQSWKTGLLADAVIGAVCDEVCPYSDDSLHHGTLMSYIPNRDHTFNAVCQYCGATFPAYDADLAAAYGGFVSDLNYTTTTDQGLFSIYPSGWVMENSIYLNSSGVVSGFGGFSYSGYVLENYSGHLGNVYSAEFSLLPGVYNFVFDSASGYTNSYSSGSGSYYRCCLYAYKEDGSSVELFECGSAGSTFPITKQFTISPSSEYVSFKCWSSFQPAYSASAGTLVEGDRYCHIEAVELADSSFSSPDPSSRTSSLMQTIHTYNTNNSYVDNGTNVNFFIVPRGDEPSADTAISPSIYDEETLVYTDPVTGTQYLTNGWTYDYLTRCYTLDMADESYKIGDTVIDTIKLTYGDELLTVDHYSGGSLIQSDEYNYVMMSGSACAIDGHTYNVETTKEPTCTAAGERTYTCSVCGNQYVEEIAKTDHAYGNYEIVQEATCTAPGIASYTCTTCGGQYTDTLPALGHDWQPTAATEESYVMPDNVYCPDCYGSDFTYTRSDYEILTGKNLFNFPERNYVYENAFGPDCVRQFDSNSAYVGLTVNNYFNPAKIFSFEYDSDLCSFSIVSEGGAGVGFPFVLSPGKQYSLSAVTSGNPMVFISFYDSEGELLSWSAKNFLNSTFTVPDGAYWTVLVFRYSDDLPSIDNPVSFSQVQLEEGSEITEYEPYTTKEIEIIPPIYTFTCSDCSTVWTKEAEYQGATVTYTCTRCHETRTEASGEEAGLFHSIGNLIADGITWATDKLTELVENLSGINKTFNDYANSIRENTGQFPAFLGAILALMPEDFMNVIWLGVVALVALAVWKKWFS